MTGAPRHGPAGTGRPAPPRRPAGQLAGRVSRLRRVPARGGFVLALFVGSKVVLTLVGVLALHAWDGVPGAPPADETMARTQQHAISPHRWISLWFAWDSFLYDHLSPSCR